MGVRSFLNKYVGFGLVEDKALDFKGTIDGGKYFFRPFAAAPAFLISLVALFVAGQMTGVEWLLGIPAGIYMLGSVVYSIILSLSTVWKRYRALWPSVDPLVIYLATLGVALLANIFVVSQGVAAVLGVANLVFSIYVLAKNTNCKNEG